MNFELLNQPYLEKLARIICLTLVHSIWQGLILAVLAGVMLMLTRKSKPAFRYNILALLLTVFLAASCVTFGVLNRENSGNAGISIIRITNFQPANLPVEMQVAEGSATDLLMLITDF